MLQTQTKILIKDNSGLLQGKIINSGRANSAALGHNVKVTITRAKSKIHRSTGTKSTKIQMRKGQLQNLIVIQTKKLIQRYDGSTIKFNSNCGVCIAAKQKGAKKRITLGFKRINTSVPYELRWNNGLQAANINLLKLAKNII